MLKHGRRYEPVAKRKYCAIVEYKMKRSIFLRETGLVKQPVLFLLGANPDGLIYDKKYSEYLVYSKLNSLPTEEILLQRIFSEISLSISSKTKMGHMEILASASRHQHWHWRRHQHRHCKNFILSCKVFIFVFPSFLWRKHPWWSTFQVHLLIILGVSGDT